MIVFLEVRIENVGDVFLTHSVYSRKANAITNAVTGDRSYMTTEPCQFFLA